MAPDQTLQIEPASPRGSVQLNEPSRAEEQHQEPLSRAQQPDEKGAAHAQQPIGNPYALYPQSYGQPIAPYPIQGLPQQPQHMTYVTLPRPEEPKRRRLAKDILHVVVMVSSIIGIGFAFSLLRSGNGIVTLAGGVIFIAAFLWSFAEIVVRFVRKTSRAGIHPGAHVGVCLCLWLLATGFGSLLATILSIIYIQCVDDIDVDVPPENSRESRYSYSRTHPRSCGSQLLPLFTGATAMLLTVAALEIVLFIFACVDTHLRNRWKSNLVIASTPYWAPPPPQGQSGAPLAPQPAVASTNMPAPAPRQQDMTQPPAASAPAESSSQARKSEHTVHEYYTPGQAQ